MDLYARRPIEKLHTLPSPNVEHAHIKLARQLAKNKRRTAISRIIFLGFHLEGFRFEKLIEEKLIKKNL
jgi:hypothetical protein